MKDRARHGRTHGAVPPPTVRSSSCPRCGAGLYRGYGLAFGGMGEYAWCPRCDWHLKDREQLAVEVDLAVGVAGTGTHEDFRISSASILAYRPCADCGAAVEAASDGEGEVLVEPGEVVLIPRADGGDEVVTGDHRRVTGRIQSSESGLPVGGYERGRRVHAARCPF